jgi:phage baseplate assembly protein gpV
MGIEDIVRVGAVSDVDAGNLCARVIFRGQDDMVSDWLRVVQRGGTTWLPKVNDAVLVLYLPIFNGNGYILGAV